MIQQQARHLQVLGQLLLLVGLLMRGPTMRTWLLARGGLLMLGVHLGTT